MKWNNFLNLDGKHAMLPPSQATRWATKDLDPEDLEKMIINGYAQQVGTLLHSYAEDNIRYSVKMIKSDKKEVRKYLLKNGISENVTNEYVDRCFLNLMNYVNDAIGFRMEPEVALVYSSIPQTEYKAMGIDPPIFGTADAISFKNNLLRIHDLKTGTRPAHIEQLGTYAALFCLQQKIKPGSINIELRLYQNDEVVKVIPEADDILPIMDRIVRYDKFLTKYLQEV